MLVKTVHNHKDGSTTEVVCCTAENFRIILQHDERFRDVVYNVMIDAPVKRSNGRYERWSGLDDAEARTYIEKEYGIFNNQKYEDGFQVMQSGRRVHPVQELLSGLQWDGKPRLETFLIDWLGCEDTPYTREVSRLIFAGGVNRAFEPGCKFEVVAVLIGSQGGGKSTMTRLLAMDDSYYASLKTISGQKGEEATEGVWICEIEELLAVLADKPGTGAEEKAKAFISAQKAHYRRPYSRRVEDVPRTCIFIGTTNRNEFLTDKTGNRRWFPVRCTSDGSMIFSRQAELKESIRQCWAEMTHAYKAHDALARPVERHDLLEGIRQAQEDAQEEDWRTGFIKEYLQRTNKDKVCLLELWTDALYPEDANAKSKYTRAQAQQLSEIMVHQFHWIRGKTTWFTNGFGQQKAYLRPETEKTQDQPPAKDPGNPPQLQA